MAAIARIAVVCTVGALALPATSISHARAFCGGSYLPFMPKVSIFYYPWYGTPARDGQYVHWSQNGHAPPGDIASNYYPARGVYSSSDPAVLRSQMIEIRKAGIAQIIVSWWGRGSAEDKRLPSVIAAARRAGLETAIHIEPYQGRTPASVADDILYLEPLMGGGNPEFFVFQPSDSLASEWATALHSVHCAEASTGGASLIYAQTALAGAAVAGSFDGVYTYDTLTYGGDKLARFCQQASKARLQCLPSVGPGYDARRATGDTRVKSRRNGATYDSMWHAAIAAHPFGVTITSYNEWHEGTQIEPALGTPDPTKYLSYEGAWGLHGQAAANAYLTRTAYWVTRFLPTRKPKK